MPQGTGWASVLGVGNETVWGTLVARTKFIEHVGISGGLADPLIEVDSFRGRTLRRHIRGLKKVEAELKCEANFEGQELLWYHLFGSVATTTPSGGTNSRQHTFTMVDATLAGLSVEVKKGDAQTYTWNGCKVASCELEFALDKVVGLTFAIVGKDEATGSATPPTYPAELPIRFDQVTLQKDGVTFGVREASVSIDNGLIMGDDLRQMGTRNMKEPIGGRRSITGTLVIDLEDNAYHALLTADTAFKLNFIGTGATIEGAIPYKADLELPVCVIVDDSSDIGDRGPIRLTLNFVAKYNIAGGVEGAKLTLTNTVTAIP